MTLSVGYVSVSKVQEGQVFMVKNDSAHERLIQVAKQALNREWIDQYLDLVKELIEFTELENDDPRLVLSLTPHKNFPVTINGRYVLEGFRKRKPLVGFIFPYDFEQLPDLLTLAFPPEFSSQQYSPHSGETAEQAPYFLGFEGLPKELLTIEQKLAWKRAILSEVKRCKGSPYKKFHESIVYEAAVNPNYRASLLNEAFPDQHQLGWVVSNAAEGLSTEILYEKIFSELVYDRDERSPPDNRRRAQFKIGWENATLKRKPYTDKTLNAILTWNNLGYRFGIKLGHQSESEINKVYDFLSQGYSIKGTELNAASAARIFPDEVTEETFREGAVRQVSVNAYERDPKARQKCIEYYGLDCSVCSFNFSKVFGQLGEGFIHVHHLRPISEIRSEYEVDPIKDLRPVCPNCHAMIHRHSPPLSIEEIKMLLAKLPTSQGLRD
ncbi:MAG TPA: HNH endonuclease [Halomicronema sp.]